MADKLQLYNDALLLCGERFLGALNEEREPRRLLDQAYITSPNACLEEGLWNFALRTVQMTYDPSYAPTFGYRRAFGKPSDWSRTAMVCEDEFFRVPLLRYRDETGFLYADLDIVYASFVSNATNYGGSMANWSTAFYHFVAADLASKIILKLSNSEEEWKKLSAIRENRLNEAKKVSAMSEPTTFPAQGAWTRSRNRWMNRRDGGLTSGPLIGG
jgi:hypothetical protein